MTRYNEIHAFQPEAWREDAACKGYPTNWWYPTLGHVSDNNVRAKRMCQACPVREDCLTAAMRRDEDGLWGGMNYKERRTLRREQNLMRYLICIRCRTQFEKPAGRHVVALYCSDTCRKTTKSIRVLDARRHAS